MAASGNKIWVGNPGLWHAWEREPITRVWGCTQRGPEVEPLVRIESGSETALKLKAFRHSDVQRMGKLTQEVH